MPIFARVDVLYRIRDLGKLLLYAILVVLLVLLVRHDVARYLALSRGIESGLNDDQPPLIEPRFGVNVALERYASDEALDEALTMIRSAGFGTIRQRFSWAEMEPQRGEYLWARWDHVLSRVREHDLQIIAILDTSPSWARPSWESENPWAPPTSIDDYALFVGRFAERYGDWVMAYQIWDQPNISPHWGVGPIDPARYVDLLRASSESIRSVDADALIVAGELAPNLEGGGRNMSDLQFLREIYRRGAGAYFDVLGAKAYGFWSGPDDRRVDADVLNFSRTVLLRSEMVHRGEGYKPIWALESGWSALPGDWQGRPSPQGNDDPLVQAERLERAIVRVQEEWSWLGLMCMLHFQPNAAEDDPIWGYALLGPNGEPRPVWERLQQSLHGEPTLYPGLNREFSRYLHPISGKDLTDFSFWGTDLIFEVETSQDGGRLAVAVDELHTDVIVDLDGEEGVERVHIGSRLSARAHKVRIRGTPEEVAALRAVQIGYRPPSSRIWLSLLAGGVGLACLGWAIWSTARTLPWGQMWSGVRKRWLAIPAWLQVASIGICFSALFLAPTPIFALVGLGLYGLNALLRPDLALLFAVASIPFAPIHVQLGPGSFSLAEVSLLSAVGAHLWGALFASPSDQGGILRRIRAVRLHWVDWVVLLLVLLGLGTSLVAEYQHVALREWRVVVCGSALLYLLLRAFTKNSRDLERLADVLWLFGVLVALYALARYFSPEGVIEAEGVRRARAFYGSPNNLALYLERVLPLGVSVGLWGGSNWRRWVYRLGVLPIGMAMLLTFSRGSLLLGVPAALLVLGWMRGGRARWIASGVVVIGVLGLVLFTGVARLSTALDLAQGTTYLRISLWRAAWAMVCDHPWLGVGLDNFLYYYGDYILPGAEVERWLSHPHNLVLDFWLRLGIGGVMLLVGLLVGFAHKAVKAYRSLPEGDSRAMALGFVGGMAAAVAHGSIDSFFFVIELAYWFLFALAWVTMASQARSSNE
ncbi:MAG: hypothetical protein A2Y73_00365 [Chloroflexi bacterium RBG_13_56_8]|nr:MAG: hypothetical protein A2Y73_00365 [Chloroflexi bacterium RBG_13_56_8]